jgi:hypothetical protein
MTQKMLPLKNNFAKTRPLPLKIFPVAVTLTRHA